MPNAITGSTVHLQCSQEKNTCDQKGRDCIERNFTRTFSCNTTCEGTYADVQKINNDIEEIFKQEPDEGKSSNKGERVDKMKFQKLISEYKRFKKNRVQHFIFNSAATQTAFGKLKIVERSFCFQFFMF